MSELMNARDDKANIRTRLLTTVSALALLGSVYGAGNVQAADGGADRPLVWIELGGQLSRLNNGQEDFAPSLMTEARPSIFAPFQGFEQPSRYSIDEYGKISFQPEGWNWSFSAAVRYGRSAAAHHSHQQTTPSDLYKYHSTGARVGSEVLVPVGEKFSDTRVKNSETHLILDFQASRDVGLGLFDRDGGTSVFGFGVRIAQFNTRSNVILNSDPDFGFAFKYGFGLKIPQTFYHINAASMQAERSFHGIGPSISWDASAPIIGDLRDGEVTFDWGVNAAFLFGRQRAQVHRQTTAQYHAKGAHAVYRTTVGTPINTNHTRSRSVSVPNVEGFAGLSFRYANAKISAGYRADFFSHAMDGGIDTRKSENVGFYGPFASVSVGLGG